MDPKFGEYEVKKLRSPASGRHENAIFPSSYSRNLGCTLGYSCTEMRAIIHVQQMRCCYAHSARSGENIFLAAAEKGARGARGRTSNYGRAGECMNSTELRIYDWETGE